MKQLNEEKRQFLEAIPQTFTSREAAFYTKSMYLCERKFEMWIRSKSFRQYVKKVSHGVYMKLPLTLPERTKAANNYNLKKSDIELLRLLPDERFLHCMAVALFEKAGYSKRKFESLVRGKRIKRYLMQVEHGVWAKTPLGKSVCDIK